MRLGNIAMPLLPDALPFIGESLNALKVSVCSNSEPDAGAGIGRVSAEISEGSAAFFFEAHQPQIFEPVALRAREREEHGAGYRRFFRPVRDNDAFLLGAFRFGRDREARLRPQAQLIVFV